MPAVSDIAATLLPGLVVVVVALAASELGYRIGRRLKISADEAMRTEINTIQAGTLSLLALLLGFSFSIGADAYENRRNVVLEEAVVLATAHQRAGLLSEPAASEVRALLVRYVDARQNLFYQGILGEPAVRERLRESERLQAAMWESARGAARSDPRSIPVGLLLETLSQVGDLNQRRGLALRQAVPLPMVVALIVTAAVAMGWVGCGIGLGARRNFAMSVVLSLLFGVIIAFIVDMDQPRHGLVRSDPRPLIELQESLKAPP
jgi:hypothetical protein